MLEKDCEAAPRADHGASAGPPAPEGGSFVRPFIRNNTGTQLFRSYAVHQDKRLGRSLNCQYPTLLHDCADAVFFCFHLYTGAAIAAFHLIYISTVPRVSLEVSVYR
eukprot:COSAG05_NODE_3381_length_2097_cov_1.745746_2_plen_107_part_00